MEINEAIDKRVEFDEYIVCKRIGETKGRFIDSLVEYYFVYLEY